MIKLRRSSFLSLWSYPNLYTDEGRKGGMGPGKELCDVLIVFGNHVLLFSDKHIGFSGSVPAEVAWKRWFRRAIDRSARQLYGAETWLRKNPSRIYLDASCREKIPVALPDPGSMQIHRIAVARGVFEACSKYWNGQSLGTLMVASDLKRHDHYDHPFQVGHVNPEKGFVHVFDEFTLEAVIRELDTISDFVQYLEKKDFLTKPDPHVLAAGEEQLLALYLTRINDAQEHDFCLPNDEGKVYLDEGFWESMIQNPHYRAKKEADKISYSWDSFIEHLIEHGKGLESIEGGEGPIIDQEPALRLLASESRVRRRQLAQALKESRHPRNYSWAELLSRVFEIDVLECPECGGGMRILCAINPPEAIRKILDCLDLPSRPPPISPAVEESYLGI